MLCADCSSSPKPFTVLRSKEEGTTQVSERFSAFDEGEKKDTQNKRNPARDKGFEQAKRDSTFEMANLSVGRLYQVDHLQLPYDSPIPKDIEIVMVSKITELKVSLWYSTVDLLRKHFENPERPHFPHLAKRCDMDLRYARALVRMISNEEVATKVDNLRFWTVDSLNEEPLWEIYGRKRGDVEDAEERGMKALPKSKRSRKGKQPSENENTSASSEVEQCLKSLTLAVLSNSGSFLKAFDWDDLDFGSPVSPKVILQRLSNELDNEIAAVDNHKEKLQNFKKKVAEALQALS